jgi:putative PIG3 family NAD(P)H quinone oxidoreductase
MYAITIREPGGPEAMEWTEVPDPRVAAGQVLIDVAAAGINRADLLQRQGNYPPPPGASEILGLECSGVIAELGAGVTGWQVGDRVCALLSGGGYAERVCVPVEQVLPVPAGVELVAAAALPEVACTVWSNVVMLAGLSQGEIFLVHGGASGIGTHAIQVAKALGAAKVAVTAGSDSRLARCRELGADITINYREQDFVEALRSGTDGQGADVVLDNMGASYLQRNVDALAVGGRLAIIGMQGGVKGELNLGSLMGKRGTVSATGLRGRSVSGPGSKGDIVAEVASLLWPFVESGAVSPIVHEVLPVQEAAEAHRLLERGDVFGKAVLLVKR